MRKTKNLFGSIVLILIGLTACYAGAVEVQPLASGNEDRIELQAQVAEVYTAQIGVRELTGRNDGVMVEQYLTSAGFGKGYAWCAAFVTWTFDQAGIPAIHSAWSPSWFPPSKTIFTKGKQNKLEPDRADVFGVYYPTLKRIGHVGFIDKWPDGDYAITVEGNTNSGGSREGDGVYRKRRLKSNVYKVSRWISSDGRTAMLYDDDSPLVRLAA